MRHTRLASQISSFLCVSPVLRRSRMERGMVKKETKGARRQKVIWSIRGYSQRRKTALILWSAACRDNEDRRKDDGTAEKGNIKEAFKYVCSYFHMDGKELMNTNVKRKLK